MKQLVRASSASSLMPNPTLLTTRWVVFKHFWPQSIAGNIFYSEAQSTPTHISWKHFHDMMLLVNDFFLLCFNENADGDLIRWFRQVLMGCSLQCFIWWIFFFFWLCCIFIAAFRLSLVAVQRLLIVVASLVGKYGLWVHRLQQLQHVSTVVVAHGL